MPNEKQSPTKASESRIRNKAKNLAIHQSPLGRRVKELRKHLNDNGYKINNTNYKTGKVDLKPPKSGASESEVENWVKAATEMATTLRFTVKRVGKQGIILDEPHLKKGVAKATPAQEAPVKTAPQKAKVAPVGKAGKARKTHKGVRLSEVRIANKSTGGMRNHVTMSGSAFMGIIEGISPVRLTEAVLVFMGKLSLKSKKAFAQKIAEAAGISTQSVPEISKEDLKLLKKIKKLGIVGKAR